MISMTINEEVQSNWKKAGLVRFHNADDFCRYKYGSKYKSKHREEYNRLKAFEETIKKNKGEYFLLELVNAAKLLDNKGDYVIGILRGDICYSVGGKRYGGEAFESMSDISGFLQNFYTKEIILRTKKRAYTTGGKLPEVELKKIREDPALSIEDIINNRINYLLGDGRRGVLRTLATKFSTDIAHLKPFLECNLPESK